MIIPIRPPKNMTHFRRVNDGEVALSVDDVWFSYEQEGPLTHIELFIRGHDPENDGTLGAAAFLLLDLALGEYVVETRVGGIARKALPDDPEAQGLRPLTELPAVVRLPIQ